MSEKRHYISYLLRLWQAEQGGELIWRASLESPHSGAHRSFVSLDRLWAFLKEEIGHIAQERSALDDQDGGGEA